MSLMDRLRGNESDEGTTTNLPSRALLWLIASFALLLSPQWDRLPLWLIAACAVLAAWRWLSQYGRVRLPCRVLRPGTLLVLLGV